MSMFPNTKLNYGTLSLFAQKCHGNTFTHKPPGPFKRTFIHSTCL